MLAANAMADETGPAAQHAHEHGGEDTEGQVTIQRGNGLGLVMISFSRLMASSRPTPPATMSVTSWCTLARPA